MPASSPSADHACLVATTTKVVGVALMIGAIMNVAVAWGCAFWLPEPPTVRLSPIRSATTWPGPVPVQWPFSLTSTYAENGHIRQSVSQSTCRSVFTVEDSSTAIWYEFSVHTVGFPMRSMRFDVLREWAAYAWPGVTDRSVSVWHQGLPLTIHKPGPFGPMPETRQLPLRPSWPGFAVDTLLFAVVAAPAVLGAAWLARMRRTSAGLCAACCYPTTGLLICPECGRPVPPRRSCAST